MERERIDAIMPDIEAAAENAIDGGGSIHGGRYIMCVERISELIDRVGEMGIIVKDVDAGLCDFPYDQGGELVLLCWRVGEPEVAWWHGLNEGFKGRRNIDELD